MSDPASTPIKLSSVEEGIQWERMSGQRLSRAERQRLVDGGAWKTPSGDALYDPSTPVPPRPVTKELLFLFAKWTREDALFTGSMEGQAFGEELREVFRLASKGLEL